jgi:cyclopropane-fatty-acyl-phospholipid synthase
MNVVMRKTKSRKIIEEILSAAGITVNGEKPWDIRVSDERFYQHVFCKGSLGLGESYMEGWWECERLDDFFGRIMPLHPENKVNKSLKLLWHSLNAALLNKCDKSGAFEIGKRHYDIGNDLYVSMLDKRMVYSCAYWKDADNLDDAQETKLDLICRKLNIRSGDRILDIGCGWGSFAKYAAEKYGTEVVGVTVSKEQVELGQKICAGLPVEIRLQDYRDVDEKFDHVVSIGMFEHVGYKNYETYMKKVYNCLYDGGLFLLHTIGRGATRISSDPWIDRYIFPNYCLPSVKQITSSIKGLFVVEDWHNFGSYYATTLNSWFNNFDCNWEKLKHAFDSRFYRMWKYYLLSCAGAFKSRELHVWQIVLSKKGIPGGYQSIR